VAKGDRVVDPRDIAAALGLLSRLPVPVDGDHAMARGGRAAWAWPLVGGLIAALAALVGSGAMVFGLTPALAAALVLAAGIAVTGGLHEDGLADSADGLWGGWDRERRLAIMGDSRIGTYGVLALGLSLLLRWSALTTLAGAGWLWPGLLATGALSRAAMVVPMTVLPPARPGGLSGRVGRPQGITTLIAVGLGAVIAALATGIAVLPACAAVGAVVFGWCLIARARIGGQTGDILGATQQLAEITVLLVLVALL